MNVASNPPPLLPSTETRAEIVPSEILLRALRGWWLVALCFLVGGLAGLVAHALRPPEYESGFDVISSIDFVRTGELTQFEEDLSMEVVGNVLYSPVFSGQLVQAAQAEGLFASGSDRLLGARVERRLGTWRVRVRATDPASAERLAALWLKLGEEALTQARAHALVADGLQRRQSSLEECLSRAANAEPSAGLCSPLNLKELQTQLAESGQLLLQERMLSKGLSSAVIFGDFPSAPQTAHLAAYERGQLAAGGALIGLAIGIWAVQADWAGHLARRRRA